MTDDDALQALGRVHVHDDEDAVAAAAARMVHALSEHAIAERGAFSIALAGGNTPKRLYELLASPQWRERIRWNGWRVYFGDERAVPPDEDESNYRMARESLLERVPIDSEHVHRMRGELQPDEASAAYHSLLQATLPASENGIPQFDLVLLGVGENGHTASLFPDTPALEVVEFWATPGRADYPPYERITLTFPVLNAARAVLFTVTGGKKHEALHATASGGTPAAGVQPVSGPPHWLLDRSAASGDRDGS